MGRTTSDDEIRQLLKQLSQLARALERQPQRTDEVGTIPAGLRVDAYLTDEELVFFIDLPGVERDQLKISASRDALIIEGTRARQEIKPEQTYLMAERPFGPFKRSLDLAVPVDTRNVEASLKNGLLIIRLPRMVERRGQLREIPLRVTE